MQLRCTCGAYLPDDARFCHKCGKPQYEEDVERAAAFEDAARPVQPQTDAVELSPAALVSFRNTRAVVISLAVAAAAFFCFAMSALVSPILPPLVLLGAGFLAALLYGGGAGQPLSTVSGARIGWMTGLCLFAGIAIAAALSSIYLTSASGSDAIKQLQSMPQFSQLSLNDPHAVLMNVLLSFIPTFFMVTLLPGLGGILGAKLSRGRR